MAATKKPRPRATMMMSSIEFSWSRLLCAHKCCAFRELRIAMNQSRDSARTSAPCSIGGAEVPLHAYFFEAGAAAKV